MWFGFNMTPNMKRVDKIIVNNISIESQVFLTALNYWLCTASFVFFDLIDKLNAEYLSCKDTKKALRLLQEDW